MTTDALPADIRLVVNTRYGITIEATTDSAIHWLESDLDWSPDSTDRPWSAHADTAVGVVVALDAQRIGLRVQVVDEASE